MFIDKKFIGDQKKLVVDFQMEFYKQYGFIPIVLRPKSNIETTDEVLEELQKIVESTFKRFPTISKVDSLKHKRRTRELVELRVIFSYIAKQLGYKMVHIGKFLERDHTTIIHYIKLFSILIQTSTQFNNLYNTITQTVNERIRSLETIGSV